MQWQCEAFVPAIEGVQQLPCEALTITINPQAFFCLMVVWLAILILATELLNRQAEQDQRRQEHRAAAIRRQLCPEQEVTVI